MNMSTIPTRTVGVNELGRRIGEDHPKAKLTDRQVEMIRQLHEDYHVPYSIICEVLIVSKSTIEDICCYNTRTQLAIRRKTIR